MKITFATKIALGIAVAVSALFFTSLDAYRTIDKLIADGARESRVHQTLALVEQIDSRINKAQDWLQSYLDTGSDDSLREFENADGRINELLDELRQSTQDSASRASLLTLELAVARRVAGMREALPMPGERPRHVSSQELRMWRNDDRRIDAQVQGFKRAIAGPAKAAKKPNGDSAKTVMMWADFVSLALLLGAAILVVGYERRRQRAESTLRDSEAMSRAITESMVEGLVTTRVDGTIVSANAAAAKIFAAARSDDLLGRNVVELVPERQREDFRILLDMLAAREEGFREGDFETRGLRLDGREFPGKVSFGDVRMKGERLFTGMVRDMTRRHNATAALKASEAQLREITDAVPALIYYADSERRIRFHNRLVEEWFGLKTEEVTGRTLAEVVGPEAYEAVRPNIDQVLRGYPVRYERQHRMASGAIRDLSVFYYPRYHDDDPSGSVMGYYALVTDITELKRIDRMKTEFVSTVSHELRTPLTSIRGSLGLISGGIAGPLPESAKGLVDIAQSNCERLIRLINDILDTEKIESGKMNFEMKAAEMKPLLEQALAANEGFARQHGVSFTLSAPTMPLHARVDVDRLMQVVTNLVSNAVKFSPKGATVDVALSQRAERIRVEVADHGPGIPENFRSRIFQKFSQADSSDTRQKGGTGLGLNISRAIVERFGGTIGFNSEVGVGTTFAFELPQVEGESERAGGEEETRRRVLVCEEKGDIARILHVEDDPDIRRVAAAITRDFATFEFAATVREARARLGKEAFDLVLLDLALPDGTGWMLMDEIERLDPPLPVVIFSASDIGPTDAKRASAVLVKAQTSNEMLSQTIHRALDERVLQKAA